MTETVTIVTYWEVWTLPQAVGYRWEVSAQTTENMILVPNNRHRESGIRLLRHRVSSGGKPPTWTFLTKLSGLCRSVFAQIAPKFRRVIHDLPNRYGYVEQGLG